MKTCSAAPTYQNEDESIVLYNADCLDIMPSLPKVDLVLADPPYGTTACKWDSIIPLDAMWERVRAVANDNAAIVMTASQPFTSALVSSNYDWFRYSWVWDKRFAANFGVAKIQPLKRHEDVLVFAEKKSPAYNPQMIKRDKPIKIGKNSANSNDRGMLTKNSLNNPEYDHKTYDLKYPESIQLFNVRADKDRFHPTQKPVALMEYLIKTYTNEGDTVLDFTMGSGTTGVACVNTGRKFIGIELDETYFNIAQKRIEEALVNGTNGE